MIRDERQVALDETIVSLQDEAAQTRDSAERLGNDDERLAQVLRANATQFEYYANRLKPDMQILNDLPREPVQEIEILEGLFSRIQAAFSGDPRRSALDERLQGIHRLADCVDAALQTQPPQPIVDHLQALRRYLHTAGERLHSLAP